MLRWEGKICDVDQPLILLRRRSEVASERAERPFSVNVSRCYDFMIMAAWKEIGGDGFIEGLAWTGL